MDDGTAAADAAIADRAEGTAQRETVESTSDERTVNNTMRHQYRVLNDEEKAAMQAVKDCGEEFLKTLHNVCRESRETSLAKTKIEEAVMWAVKGITA
jgi:hypothetical protein